MKISALQLLVVAFLLLPFFSTAQHKFEREYRIKSAQVPDLAKEFVDSIGPTACVKWFQEESKQGTSIEAKFKHNQRNYSVEFDPSGNLQDVEFIVQKGRLPATVRQKIQQQLEEAYTKWRFLKIQLQYQGAPNAVLISIHQKKPSAGTAVFYEIVLKGKTSGMMHLYESTFDVNGTLLQTEQILQEKTDHLDY